ncbi:MAG: universal stress protein [Crocinitomicaceae bacterium]
MTKEKAPATSTISSVLLLTDFSEPARNALRYAVDAFGNGVQYYLVNAYYARTSSATLIDLNEMLQKESAHGLEEERKWLIETYKDLKVQVHSIYGSPVDAVRKIAGEHDPDFAVMGTKGASGLDAVLYGSVASSVIRAALLPVISIPPDFSFKGFKEIVFAMDGEMIYDQEVISPIRKLQQKFNAEVNVFSVESGGKHVELGDVDLDIENAHYSKVEDKNVADAITKFCNEKKADLLVVLPKHTGFFERLFHSSISKELVEQAKMPILALENV